MSFRERIGRPLAHLSIFPLREEEGDKMLHFCAGICKCLSCLFLALALLASYIMCIHVSFAYCNMQWGILTAGYSAPANVAFLYAMPYILWIVVCVTLAWKFHKSGKI